MSAQFEHSLLSLPENHFAQAALERLLGTDPDFSPRLVYLFGPAGVGKSHLVVEQVRQFLETYEGVQHRLLPLYEFATLNLEASSTGTFPLLDQIQELDLIVLEELHCIENQSWLQKKLVILLDELLQNETRVILTSQLAIGEMQQAIPKLVSRCHGGITSSIALPSEQSRISLLQHFAEHHNFQLPADAALELARKLPVSPRELLGVTLQLEAIHQFEQTEITLEVVKNFLELHKTPKRLSLAQITNAVAKEFRVTAKGIRSETREQQFLIPRQVGMYLSRKMMRANYAEIGHFYGGRSHSTVMHACKSLQEKIKHNSELEYRIVQLKRQLQGYPGKPK